AGEVDGKLRDASHLIEHDATVRIITAKDPEGLEVIRHSTAHLLAQAVQRLFPEAQVTIGPVIENGFYYDFAYPPGFTPEDLERIAAEMQRIVKDALPVSREVWNRDDAIRFFREQGEEYKAEIIGSLPEGEAISVYRQGDFLDLCRGPHVPDTGKLGDFKLTKLAGAYWRGDSNNEMLQRIYGTAWPSKKELEEYLHRLEEAEKRDHRRLGKQLDLFHFQEEAPGMVFWHDKGWRIYTLVQDYMRAQLRRHGYLEVNTPEVVDIRLWEKSGHADKFIQDMFLTESENRNYAIKPMNCPCHIQIYNQGLVSYRDLPLRLAEFGSCHRNEPSGALHGLMRVRAFKQDDAHIFCTPEQVGAESAAFIELLYKIYADFGFNEVLVLQRGAGQAVDAAGEPHRRRRVVGPGGGRAGGRAGRGRHRLAGEPGRGRVLRSEDRVFAEGHHRPRLAVRHAATGFQHARPPRRELHRRGQRPPDPGHAAPCDPGIAGALHRHPDRKLRRRLPGVAGAGAGRGAEYHRKTGRFLRESSRNPWKSRLPRGIGLEKREDRL
ncbi:MAG: threonine--tRNA ligase, partial [Nitratireductor sp.]|nr:threonine--tRNA ligase [Nitratireductor sp.]